MPKRLSLALAATLMAPAGAFAQASQCSAPALLPRPDYEGPSADQPRRVIPTASYTLALMWSPQICRGHAGPDDAIRCGGGSGRFGFTLHGLWPDGYGRDWPQYCRPATLLPPTTLRRHLCATPSVQLLQHEWAKHGTCMTSRPEVYFGRSNALYGVLHYPDMDALSRREGLSAGDFATAFAAANPGMKADMMRVTANREGWLSEVWLCVDKAFGFKSCPAHQGGLPPEARLRIWRGD